MREINQYYTEWKALSVRLCKGDTFRADDLLHEVLCRLIERSIFPDLIAQGTINYYVRIAIAKEFRYPRSPFNQKYTINTVEFTDNVLDKRERTWIGARLDNETIDLAIKMLPDYEREIFLLWSLDGFSYRALSQETGIAKMELYLAVKKSKKLLRQWLVKLR